jgi:hypothetical protein
MCNCIMKGDIEMDIKYWEEDWKITTLNQEMPTKTVEEEVGQEET